MCFMVIYLSKNYCRKYIISDKIVKKISNKWNSILCNIFYKLNHTDIRNYNVIIFSD